MATASNVDVANEQLCILCYKICKYFSLGPCEHRVCYECSTRMRVLCSQNECPICRAQMKHVIFTENPTQPYASLYEKLSTHVTKDIIFGIIFENKTIQLAYEKLLENRCNKCGQRFSAFAKLKDHMRREHSLSYCELCVEHLKLFNCERRSYDRQELATHRRVGDADNKSHRGHPLCQFCDIRFMDNDALYKHLRSTHFYCHFCDADGKQQYYFKMDDLVKHFAIDHYLCEEGSCKDIPLTSVFRTEIDLKAHIALTHGTVVGRAASKHARTLDLDFAMTPRPRVVNRPYTRRDDACGYTSTSRAEADTGISRQPTCFTFEPGGHEEINPFDQSSFPALNGDQSSKNVIPQILCNRNYGSNQTNRLGNNFDDNFPQLPHQTHKGAPTVGTQPSTSSRGPTTPNPPTTGKKKQSAKSTDYSNTQKNAVINIEQFPMLATTSRNAENGNANTSKAPLWVATTKPKVSPRKQLDIKPQENVNLTTANFPNLSNHPQPNTVTNQNTSNKHKTSHSNGASNAAKQSNTVAATSNGITFDNCSNEDFPAMHPTKSIFAPPSDFRKRNEDLMRRLQNDLNPNRDLFNELKSKSEAFKSGQLAALKYLQHCKRIMGRHFETMFPELVVLLPNIERQQQLYAICNGKTRSNLVPCTQCKQILLTSDLEHHKRTYH